MRDQMIVGIGFNVGAVTTVLLGFIFPRYYGVLLSGFRVMRTENHCRAAFGILLIISLALSLPKASASAWSLHLNWMEVSRAALFALIAVIAPALFILLILLFRKIRGL